MVFVREVAGMVPSGHVCLKLPLKWCNDLLVLKYATGVVDGVECSRLLQLHMCSIA